MSWSVSAGTLLVLSKSVLFSLLRTLLSLPRIVSPATGIFQWTLRHPALRCSRRSRRHPGKRRACLQTSHPGHPHYLQPRLLQTRLRPIRKRPYRACEVWPLLPYHVLYYVCNWFMYSTLVPRGSEATNWEAISGYVYVSNAAQPTYSYLLSFDKIRTLF